MDKLIFLDIDGVLNSELFWMEKRQCERADEEPEHNPRGAHNISEDSVDLLNHLIEKTEAKVVVSSTWRVSYTIEEFQELLECKGFKGEVVGKTPKLHYKESGYGSVMRGCEIHGWIDKNIDYKERDSLRYVILDDDSDMLYWQRENFFLVDRYCGLTPNLVYRAARFLNKYENVSR